MTVEPGYLLKVEKALQENHPTESVMVYTQDSPTQDNPYLVAVYAMIGKKGIVFEIDPVDISESGLTEEQIVESLVNDIEDQYG